MTRSPTFILLGLDMFALPSPTETGAGARPGASVVDHSVGIALAALDLIGANVTRYSGCFALLRDHILANLGECQGVGYFDPVLTRYSPLLSGHICV